MEPGRDAHRVGRMDFAVMVWEAVGGTYIKK
jgi:hypothetical protein